MNERSREQELHDIADQLWNLGGYFEEDNHTGTAKRIASDLHSLAIEVGKAQKEKLGNGRSIPIKKNDDE